MQVLNYRTVSRAEVVGSEGLTVLDPGNEQPLDQTKFFEPKDLIGDKWTEMGELIGEIKAKGLMRFILIVKQEGEWTVPDIQVFHDFMNVVTCRAAREDHEFQSVLKWSSPWGKVGILGLDTSNLPAFEKLRAMIENTPYNEQSFMIIPREILANQQGVTILLRNNHRSFDLEVLPNVLFSMNRDLQGELQVKRVKTYQKSDVTRAGHSKEGWRLVMLEGNSAIMSSLYPFHEDYKFNLGSSYVHIRGGRRTDYVGDNQKRWEPKDKSSGSRRQAKGVTYAGVTGGKPG